MGTRLRIAVRNTLRNKSRTGLNVIMIASGVVAAILFQGFFSHILYLLREKTIQSQSGHLVVASKTYWSRSAKSPKDALLNDFRSLEAIIRKNPHVRYVAGRLAFQGLVSLGEKSLGARGISLDPALQQDRQLLFLLAGRWPAPEKPDQVMLGAGLARKLGTSVGQSITVLAYTFDNVINALELEIGGVFASGLVEVDDVTFLIPLVTAQRLLNIGDVEELVVGLDRTDNTDRVAAELRPALRGRDPGIEIRTWYQLSRYYQQVDSFFRTQGHVLELILLALIVLGVINTMGMSVSERTGEIGTVRALGETERAVLLQFVLEGAVLGAMGAAVGVLVGTALAKAIPMLGLRIEIPNAGRPVPIEIDLFPGQYLGAVALALVSAIFAAVFPALRAARLNIVDALRRNM